MQEWSKMRDTVAKIDLSYLKHNYDLLTNLSQKQVFPVVKANAYGHGMVALAKEYELLGAPCVCVSSLDEALELFQTGFRLDVLIFSYVSIDDINQYHQDSFIYTVPSYEWFEKSQTLPFSVRLHLEVNTGMNRYGMKLLDTPFNFETHHLIEGVYTHFNSLVLDDLAFVQIDRFKAFVDQLVVLPKWIHVGNAPMPLIIENSWINAGRYGLALFGYRDDVQGLQPVLSLVSLINHLDRLKQGESLGYNQSYVAPCDHAFATIPIGYGDGFDMRHSIYPLYREGKPTPIIGAICMDQTMIKVGDEAGLLDEVELIGCHRNLDMISKATGISKYVLLTSLNQRIQREYIKD